MKITCDHCEKPLGVAASRPEGALAFCGNVCAFHYILKLPVEELRDHLYGPDAACGMLKEVLEHPPIVVKYGPPENVTEAKVVAEEMATTFGLTAVHLGPGEQMGVPSRFVRVATDRHEPNIVATATQVTPDSILADVVKQLRSAYKTAVLNIISAEHRESLDGDKYKRHEFKIVATTGPPMGVHMGAEFAEREVRQLTGIEQRACSHCCKYFGPPGTLPTEHKDYCRCPTNTAS